MIKVKPVTALIPPILAITTALLVHYAFITYGTGELVGSDLRGSSYDSLGDSLLRGRADVRPETIGFEGLTIAGKTYMYFGLLPALPRIALNAVWPEHWGQWARVSSLLASALSLLGSWALLTCAFRANPRWTARARSYLSALVLLGIGLGSPLLYLMSSARIYHEAIVWALAASMWGLFGGFAVLHGGRSTTRAFLVLSASTGFALLARVTFGVPLYLVLVLLLGRELWLPKSNGAAFGGARKILRVAFLALPALICLGVQLWYNFARFSSVWKFIDYRYFYLQPDLMGGEFNSNRIPILLHHYLGFSSESLLLSFPFARMFPESYRGSSIFWLTWREPTVSLLLASPWLIVAGLWGAMSGILKKKWWPVACVVALSVQALMILSYYFSTQRFATELIPWFIFGAALLFATAKQWPWPSWVIATITVAFSILISVGSTVYWIGFYAGNGDVPMRWRGTMLELLNATPPIPPWDGHRTYLDTLQRHESFSFEGVRVLQDESSVAMWGRGSQLNHGLWVHARSRITVDVPAGSTAFESIVAIPFEAVNCPKLTMVFSVLTDSGADIFRSDLFTSPGGRPEVGGVSVTRSSPQFFRVSLPETRTLTIALDDAGDGYDCDHGLWLMPAFLKPAGPVSGVPMQR